MNMKEINKLEKIISKQDIKFGTSAKKIIKSLVTSEINFYLKKLFPLNRSLTGKDNLKRLLSYEINMI